MIYHLAIALVIILTLVLLRKKLIAWLKNQKVEHGNSRFIFLLLLLTLFVFIEVVFLTFSEFLISAVIILVLFLLRKNIKGFYEKQKSKKFGKLRGVGCIVLICGLCWFSVALF